MSKDNLRVRHELRNLENAFNPGVDDEDDDNTGFVDFTLGSAHSEREIEIARRPARERPLSGQLY